MEAHKADFAAAPSIEDIVNVRSIRVALFLFLCRRGGMIQGFTYDWHSWRSACVDPIWK